MAQDNKIKSFRDLIIWKDAIVLVKDIYEVTKTFPNSEMYGLTAQIRRASVSVPSNIAEGHTRRHAAEFKHFLLIALGSLAELETQMIIANELGYTDEGTCDDVVQRTDILGKQIRSLILKLTPKPQLPTPNK